MTRFRHRFVIVEKKKERKKESIVKNRVFFNDVEIFQPSISVVLMGRPVEGCLVKGCELAHSVTSWPSF